ncbi:MAG: radical SAM protein [Anaerolineaceae bacterium]|nr:radical SAM protein [Anaerolineaceae bacterium]
MSGIALQSGIIYGPILSRRLGRSLGINLLPSKRKVCSFDCIYCQYGGTKDLVLHPIRSTLPKPPEVYAAVEAALKKSRSIDYLTFSGNGEPTIHPDFPEIVRGVKAIKDKLRPEAKLAILSNSSRVNDPEVAAALRLFDAPIMKLDAGDQETFAGINRPVGGLKIDEIVNGLQRLPMLIVQSVLVNGEITNIRGEAFELWAERLATLHPRIVQIYSTERPTAQDEVRCVSPEKLQMIATELNERHGLNVHAYWQN